MEQDLVVAQLVKKFSTLYRNQSYTHIFLLGFLLTFHFIIHSALKIFVVNLRSSNKK